MSKTSHAPNSEAETTVPPKVGKRICFSTILPVPVLPAAYLNRKNG